jgi:hypothetical protein
VLDETRFIERVCRIGLRELNTLAIEQSAYRLDYERAPVARDEGRHAAVVEQPVDRRKRATRGSSRIQHDDLGKRNAASVERAAVHDDSMTGAKRVERGSLAQAPHAIYQPRR